MSTPNTPKSNQPTELNNEELNNTNGGGLLDNLNVTSLLEGGISGSHTNEDGETESGNLGFGLGSQNILSND